MKIDGNELAIEQNELDREGRHAEAMAIKREFLKQVRESGDHCPCKQACPHHGNCFECVTLHRGHRDHLPMCMWDMVNERLHKLSRLTEGTLRSYEEAHHEKLQKSARANRHGRSSFHLSSICKDQAAAGHIRAVAR